MMITDTYAGFFGQVHGGYLAGLLAREVGQSVKVMLRRPVATGSDVSVVLADSRAVVEQGGIVVAEGAPGPLTIDVPPPIEFGRAEHASHAYLGFEQHLFPRCFCCGPERADGDGLRIFPAPVVEPNVVAAPWVPHRAFADDRGHVRGEFLWAALDCPALWSLIHHAPEDSDAHVVTGTIAMQIFAPANVEQRHVVIAWPIGAEGRKIVAGAALYTENGKLVAAAKQVCVRVEKGVPLGRARWS